MTAIRGTGPDDIWVLGRAGRKGYHGEWTASFHYDGTIWTRAAVPAVTNNAILPLARGDVWAIGDDGAVAHYDGDRWTAAKIDNIHYGLYDIGGAPDNLYVIVSLPELVHFDGRKWSIVKDPTFGERGIDSLATLPSGEVLIVRNDIGSASQLLHHVGDGWKVQPTERHGISMIAAQTEANIWAVGSFDVSDHFDGREWKTFPTAHVRVLAAYATSPTEAYLVGDSGMIQRWDGVAWRPSGSGSARRLRAVYAPSGMKPLAGGDDGLLQKL